jgi:hypothetical protein
MSSRLGFSSRLLGREYSRRLSLEFLEDRLAPATLTVNSTADTASPTDGYLTLREALAIVNSPSLPDGLSGRILGQISATLHDGGADRIEFDPTGVTGPIVLRGTQLELSLPASTARVTIDGGTAGVTVDGNNASRVLSVDAGVRARLDHLTLAHGKVQGVVVDGGGIYNNGTLALANSTLSGNSALSQGGGLYNSGGRVAVTDSTLSGNSAYSGGGLYNDGGRVAVSGSTLSANSVGHTGGGLDNSGGTVTVSGSNLFANSADTGGALHNSMGRMAVTSSTLTSNSSSGGGGIETVGGTVAVTDCTLMGNSVGPTYGGGGIHNAGGTLTVTGSILTGNHAGAAGGISSTGTLTVSDTTLSSNSGGGIANLSGTAAAADCTLTGNSGTAGGGIGNISGTLTVSGSTLSGNSGSGAGGGLYVNGGTVTISRSTLSGNSSAAGGGNGGGIYLLAGTVTVIASTIASNDAYFYGGGIANTGSTSTLYLEDTIVARNSSAALSPDIVGTVDPSSSYNLIGLGDPGLQGISDGNNYNLIGTLDSPLDPRLAPLGDYGGPTLTRALLSGSPALAAGDPSLDGTPDQRGAIRAGGVTIGAFQASAAAVVVTAPNSATAGVPFDLLVTVLDQFGHPAVGYTGTVSFTSADPHGATMPGDYTFTPADAGSHRLAGQAALYTAGPWDVSAADAAGGLSGSAPVNVLPGEAVGFVVIGPEQAVSGTPFDLTVVAVDAYGNTATGYAGTVQFTTTDGDPGVVLPADYTFGPGDAGVVTFSAGVTLVTTGDQTLTVTDLESGITGSALVTL